MRFTFVILLFCCLGANAQMIIKAHANYRPYAVAAAQNLLLDDYPNAAAAYSLRKLDKDYTGNCIRIRRTNDNSETDIGFVNNYLDTTAIKNFCGSGFSATIVTWFDQSGNGRDATQSTAGNQPTIMNPNFEFGTIDAVSSSEKAIVFLTANARLINNFSTIAQPISVFSYARKDNVTTAAAGTIYDSYNNTQSILYYTGTSETTNNRWTLAAGTGLQGTIAGTTNPSIFSTLHNSTSSSIHINGQSYVSGNAGTNGLNGLSIGNLRGNPSPIVTGYVFGGRIAEMIIYGSNQSSNRTGIENNINDYYNIYWNGDFAGLLDSFPSSAAAYSLRNLDKDYLGPLIRVRRSDNNIEQDIYGDYYGNLDTVGLKNFVGSSSGFVTVWYDQSGNARNATQTVAASQPRIVNAGIVERNFNKATVMFDGSNDNFAIPSISITTYSLFFAYSRPSPGIGQALLSTTSPTQWFVQSGGINNIQDVTIGAAATNTFTTNGQLISLFKTGGVSGGSIFRNANSLSLTAPTVGSTYSIDRLGVRHEGSFFLNGTISETIIYTSNESSNRTGIENNINSYFSIY
jgi:hypothetical protein